MCFSFPATATEHLRGWQIHFRAFENRNLSPQNEFVNSAFVKIIIGKIVNHFAMTIKIRKKFSFIKCSKF